MGDAPRSPIARVDSIDVLRDATQREIHIHLINLAKRFGGTGVLAAASDVPDLLKLSDEEKLEKTKTVATEKIRMIVERGGSIGPTTAMYIQEDLGMTKEDMHTLLDELVRYGLLEKREGAYQRARTPEQKIREWSGISGIQLAQERGEAMEREHQRARGAIVKVWAGREGLTVDELLKDMRLSYPEFVTYDNKTIIRDSLDGHIFRINEDGTISRLEEIS